MEKKLSRLRFLIKTHSLFRILRLRKERKDGSLDRLDPIARANRIGTLVCGYPFDLEHPRSFNEKISWLKFHYRNPLWERVADKLECKKYLEEIGLGKFVVPVYGAWDSVDEIDLDSLPDEFVLKATHDCGSVFLCKKGETDFEKVFASLRKSMERRYSEEQRNGEWVYDNIVPRVYAEQLLHPCRDLGDLVDYKFSCAGGHVLFGIECTGRSRDLRNNLFDESLRPIMGMKTKLCGDKRGFQSRLSTHSLHNMKETAEIISSAFVQVRVDFLVAEEGVYLTELTFFPQSGLGAFFPVSLDFRFGEMLVLPQEQ